MQRQAGQKTQNYVGELQSRNSGTEVTVSNDKKRAYTGRQSQIMKDFTCHQKA